MNCITNLALNKCYITILKEESGMKIINVFRNVLLGLYRSLRRFPVTILFSTATAVMLITMRELQPIDDVNFREMLNRITMILALGIPLSLCIKLFFERKDNGKVYKLVTYYAAGALVLLLYYFFLLDDINLVSTSRYVAVSLALYLGFLFIPYLPEREQFEMYIIKVLTGFFTTVIYSVVLYLGLAAILFTVDKLLGIHVESKVYYYTWLFVACDFAPSYFLAGIPLKGEEYGPESYPKLLKILVLYIVMPLLTAYTTILYIYFVKIIVTKEWPVGLVSHLVLWYSVIVVMVLFFITPIRDKSKWADKFYKWSPGIIIPILVMMFISIGIRINAYGVTENRYYVVVLGLWVLGIMIYFIFAKKLRNIIIPVTISIIALVSVFGPLSSFSVSRLSQNNRLETILVRNNMLKDENIQPAPPSISSADKDEISRILDYFANKQELDKARYLPEDFKMEDMEKIFGFTYESPKYYSPEGFFNLTRNNRESAIDINKYDYLFDTRNLYKTDITTDNIIDAVYDYETAVVRIRYKGDMVYEKDLNLFARELVDKYKETSRENMIPSEQMTLIEENEKIKVKFVFIHISGSRDVSTGNTKVNGLEYYMLVKVK